MLQNRLKSLIIMVRNEIGEKLMEKNNTPENRFIRLKRRYLENNIYSLNEKERLELLLLFSNSKIDSETLSKELIARFGSFEKVFQASPDVLMNIGLKDKEAALIMLMPELCKRYILHRNKELYENQPLETKKAFSDYLLPCFIGIKQEIVAILLLDKNKNILYSDVIDNGTNGSSDININKILELCISHHAVYAVLAHNHPSGITLPSDTDIEVTKRLIETTEMIGVRLLEHIIFSDRAQSFMSELDISHDIFRNKDKAMSD